MPERTPNHSPRSRGDGRIRPSANEAPSAQIPKTGTPSTPASRTKSFVRKILLASPAFPRLYADVVIASDPNSNEAKILAHNYKKIINLANERSTMANPKSCTHIKVTGVRCDSPALRGEQFCYFHQRMLRTVHFPSSRVLRSALLEDPESIQAALMEVVNGLLRGTLELKRGELILRALNTAVRNIRRVRFDLHQDEMVREIPNYPDSPLTEVDELGIAPRRRPTHEEIARTRAANLAEYFGGADKVPATYQTASPANATPANGSTPAPTHVGTDAFVRPNPAANARNANAADVRKVRNVGTAAPGCPGGPEVPGRSSVAPQPAKAAPAEVIQRKPPVSVKAEAPKEQTIAAHGVSRGRRGRR